MTETIVYQKCEESHYISRYLGNANWLKKGDEIATQCHELAGEEFKLHIVDEISETKYIAKSFNL